MSAQIAQRFVLTVVRWVVGEQLELLEEEVELLVEQTEVLEEQLEEQEVEGPLEGEQQLSGRKGRLPLMELPLLLPPQLDMRPWSCCSWDSWRGRPRSAGSADPTRDRELEGRKAT